MKEKDLTPCDGTIESLTLPYYRRMQQVSHLSCWTVINEPMDLILCKTVRNICVEREKDNWCSDMGHGRETDSP